MSTSLHAIAGISHLLQFIAVVILVNKDAGIPWDIVSRGFINKSRTYRYNLSYLVPVFPLLSSFNHIATLTSPEWYKTVLNTGVNTIRWAEYSVSAGVMLWVVCSLSGILEIRSLVAIALLNAALQYVGYLIEKAKSEGQSVTDLLKIGFALHATIWVQIITSFFTVLSISDQVPSAVYTIIFVLFGLFTSFGVVSTLWACGKIKSYETVENVYTTLSLTSKSFLTWMVYFGVLRAENRSD
jgi:hypothetical protein